MTEWWKGDKTAEPNFWDGDKVTMAVADTPDEANPQQALDIATLMDMPIDISEMLAESYQRLHAKPEKPHIIERAAFGFMDKAFVRPLQNIYRHSPFGQLDVQMEALSEMRRREEVGEIVEGKDIPEIFETASATVNKQVYGPQLIPPPEGVVEKGVEITSGVGAFVTKLAIARKFVGGGEGIGPEIMAFEVTNLADNGTPGMGILLASSLGLVGSVPAATTAGKFGKLAGQGGILASITAMEGGSSEDIAVAFFLPSVLSTIKQFPHLVQGKRFEAKIAKEVQAKGFTKTDAKTIANSVKDAVEVQNGKMSVPQWAKKHGVKLQKIRGKYNKSAQDITKQLQAIQKAKLAPKPEKAAITAKAPEIEPQAAEKVSEKIVGVTGEEYQKAGDKVDGRIVRKEVPNTGSISASLGSESEYEELSGIREVPLSDFGLTGKHYSVQGTKHIQELADEIKASGEINPLIVVVDKDGPYILEGANRAEALYLLGAKSFPAVVVQDTSEATGITPSELVKQPTTTEKQPEIMTEEEYLSRAGYGRGEIGEAALHKNIQEGRAKRQALKRMSEKDQKVIERRDELRKEYQQKVKAGEIRPPTRIERLMATAQGMPELEATKAARRLLEKQGIDWRTPSELSKEPTPTKESQAEDIIQRAVAGETFETPPLKGMVFRGTTEQELTDAKTKNQYLGKFWTSDPSEAIKAAGKDGIILVAEQSGSVRLRGLPKGTREQQQADYKEGKLHYHDIGFKDVADIKQIIKPDSLVKEPTKPQYSRLANEIQTSIKAKEFSAKEFVKRHGDKQQVFDATDYLLKHETYPKSISPKLLNRIKAVQREAKKQGVGIGEPTKITEKEGKGKPKAVRFEAGKKLTKEQKTEVLKSIGDSYKDLGAPKVEKGYYKESGDPIIGYVYNPDYMYKSDITGRNIRHYILLPDGRRAHPTELFPNIKQSEVDKAVFEAQAVEKQKQARKQELLDVADMATSVQEANMIATQRGLHRGEGYDKSVVLQKGDKYIRVISDNDVETLKAEGFEEIIRAGKKVEPTKSIAEEKKPKVKARAGFVDLTPIAQAGEQIRTTAERAGKGITRFTGLEPEVKKVLIETEEELKALGERKAKESIELYGKLTEAQEELIKAHTEKPTKHPIPKELEKFYQKVLEQNQYAKELLEEMGRTADWPNQYRAWLQKKLKKAESREKVDEAQVSMLKEAIEEAEGLEYLHRQYKKLPTHKRISRWFARSLSAKPRGVLGRKIPTREKAKELGFEEVPLAVSQAHLMYEVERAKIVHDLVLAINENPNLSLPADKAPEDWVRIDERIFPASVTHQAYVEEGKAKHRKLYRKYPIPIAEALEELTYARSGTALGRAYDKINFGLKIIGFYNPLVMTKNDAVQMWRAAGVKGFAPLVLPQIKSETGQLIFDAPKAIKIFAEKGAEYEKLRKGGLFNNVVNYTPAVKEMTQQMLNHIRETSGEKAARIIGEHLNPMTFLKDIRKLNDMTTWNMDEIMRIACYEAVKDAPILEGMSDQEKIEWVNDAMVNYGKMPKATKRALNRVMFTPQYKVGNFRFFWGEASRVYRGRWRHLGPMARTVAYKMFVKWGLPAIAAAAIYHATDEERDVRTEKGYRLVVHNPETNTDTVYALSDPLLEGAKLTQRTLRHTMMLNLAPLPSLVVRAAGGPRFKKSKDKFGEFFKLGTPIYRDVLNWKDPDKTVPQKILTQMAIAFVYTRRGREADEETTIEAMAKALSIWTDWKEQAADLRQMISGRSYYLGPGGKFGRLFREFRMQQDIDRSEIDEKLDAFIAKGDYKSAVKLALESGRYEDMQGISGRIESWRSPLYAYWEHMPEKDREAFFEWLTENKHYSKQQLNELAEALKKAKKK